MVPGLFGVDLGCTVLDVITNRDVSRTVNEGEGLFLQLCLQAAGDPDGSEEILNGKTLRQPDDYNLIRRWWRHVNAGADIWHKQEVLRAGFGEFKWQQVAGEPDSLAEQLVV